MTDMSSLIAASGKRVASSTKGVQGALPTGQGLPLKPSLSAEGGNTEEAGLRQAAQAFEAVFLRQMIGSMRSASLGEDLLGNDAGDQFRDLADARMADDMAQQQSFGIADLLLKQFGVNEAPKPQSGE